MAKQDDKLGGAAALRKWSREYESHRSIPSSAHLEPSRALKMLLAIVRWRDGLSVLDAGCGRGRNALYLAAKGCDVLAVDLYEEGLRCLRREAASRGLEKRIRVRRASILSPGSFGDERFDLILDAYVSCHLLPDEMVAYLRDLRTHLTEDGLLLTFQFSSDDEFYASNVESGLEDCLTARDSTNQIRKTMYSEPQLKMALKQTELAVPYFAKFQFDDVVQGRSWRRSMFVAACSLKRSPNMIER